MAVIKSELPTLVVKDISSKDILECIMTERSEFAKAFNYIMKMENEDIVKVSKQLFASDGDYNPYQMAFAYEVFSELGIIENKNGILRRNYNVKSVLTNSKLYDKILSIKQGEENV